ncbi:hypothetical protein VNI00_003326 [Paramarasmius palmivorus]|uniref:Pumilio homology domain family member 3 n=1 Tax=Paramarasmius palmivorus TaxID=297713 RepID=A0AAW0DTI5_9AGAR
MSNNIKVVCRFRPQNAIENREGGEIVVNFDDNLTTVQLRSLQLATGPERDGFTFDRVFPMGTQQQEVFDYGVKDIVKDVLDGYNGTVFAYGQTGSGKTFTMMGADIDSDELKGIIPRITEQIFQSIVESDAHLEYLVKVSYMEIYLEKIRDLLAPQNDNLQVHEEKSKGVYVKNLSDYYVSSAREVYEIMRAGGAARVVSSTNMNAESSRSHSIFLITINQKNTETGAQKTGNLYLVDLAGSEKVGKTGASGQTLEEAKKINKSLSALGMVINALTDPKVKYIPYRDSKLTRILQESLGGNSRTTLIINCSPSSYNEPETLSTLRFGIRAKSIKNSARVNAELSPLELKGLLAKAQAANTSYQKYIAALEAELAIWRAGGRPKLEHQHPAGSGTAAAAAPKKPATSPAPSTPVSTSRSMTPVNPAIEGLRSDWKAVLRHLPSLDWTRTSVKISSDARTSLATLWPEKESALATAEKLVKELKEELAFLKEQEATVSKVGRFSFDISFTVAHYGAYRKIKPCLLSSASSVLQVERLDYDNKEGLITVDILKEQNADAKAELEELKRQIAELKTSQKDASAEDKEKRKQEKMVLMMAKFDAQGGFSEKDEQLRSILAKLDSMDNDGSSLTQEDLTAIRRQLAEGQTLVRDTVDRLRQSQEENEMLTRRRDELESRVVALETEYEELLEKTIHDEETSNADLAESMTDLKNKLEAQYAAKRDAHVSEINDLKQQLDMKVNEVRSLNASIDSLKSVNEELKRAFAVTSAGIEGGKNLAESAQDLERTRKAINVVELEIQLDEIKEQYNNVIRNSNSKAQQKKMAFLERNLEQLTVVQKQLVDQNSTLKKEAGIAERKLLARNERIQNLEAMLQDADRRLSVQNQKFEAQLQAVKDRLDQARAQKAASSPLSFGSRIAKPLRGGGGSVPSSSVPVPISGGGSASSANPLSRLQSEEAGDSSRKPSGSSSQSRAHSPTSSPTNFPPTRLTPNTTGNMLNVGVGGAANLTSYNSGWQVWGSVSPSSKRNSQSSIVSPNELAPISTDITHRGGLHEGWSSRPTSGNWEEEISNPHSQDLAQLKDTLNIHSSRQRQAQPAPFSGPRIDTRSKSHPQIYDHNVGKEPSPVRYNTSSSPPFPTGFSSQQPGFSTSGTYETVPAPSVVDDLSLAIRGMAVEDDFTVNREHGHLTHQPHPPPPPQPTQGLPGRVPPPVLTLIIFPPTSRDPYSEYPYGYGAPTDPSLYPASAVGGSAPALYPGPGVGPQTMPVPEMHRAQQNVFYDYGVARPPQSQFYYPPHQPLIYPPAAPSMIPTMVNPTLAALADKKRELSYNMQQQLISQNQMFNAVRTTPPPPHMAGYSAPLDYNTQMSLMMQGAYNPNIPGIPMFPQSMRTVALRSPILEEFRTNKSRIWELKDIYGYIVEFSGDQHGSRFIQQKLETATSEEKQMVFDEIVPSAALQLVQDVFGNYVIQKIFEHGTQVQKTRLAAAMEGHVYPLSTQMYGCRVVQKAIEYILPEQQVVFVRELEPHIYNCVRHAHGNHVVQKLIERVSPDKLGFIQSFRSYVIELATNSYGCRVLQRCLEHLPYDMIAPLLEELHKKSTQLMSDQYGNYVIQFILEHGKPHDKALLVSKLRGQLLDMARHKFASNVCEKALLAADAETRRALVDELLVPKYEGAMPITAMMKDQFGNYVLQRAVVVADPDQREQLITHIRAQIPTMRRYSSAYNKHLLSSEFRLSDACDRHS